MIKTLLRRLRGFFGKSNEKSPVVGVESYRPGTPLRAPLEKL